MLPSGEDFERIYYDALKTPAFQYKPWFPDDTVTTWSSSTTGDCSGSFSVILEPIIPKPDLSQLLTSLAYIYPSVRIYTRERGDAMATYWKQSINWNDPNNALGGIKVSETQELSIRCTPEEKEQVIKLAEEKWETCMFESGCDPQDDYDCRKCLERRIRWETDGNILEP